MYLYDNDVLLTLVGESKDINDMKYAKMILESNESTPVRSYIQNEFINSILKKSNINFGSIPYSRGNIKDWDYYPKMMEILKTISDCSDNNLIKSKCNTINTAIDNISILSPNYSKGFLQKNQYVMTEYNLYVLCIVEAITSIISDSAEYSKSLTDGAIKITFNNNINKNSDFYFTNLSKFNSMMKTNSMGYRNMLDSFTVNGDRNNFTGVEIVGLATIASIIFLAIPITRDLVYHFYKLRNGLADSLELQSKFLIMNRQCIEANYEMNITKKKKVIDNQEKLSKVLQTLASKIRVNSVKASRDSKRELEKDNKSYSIDEIKKNISNSPIELV